MRSGDCEKCSAGGLAAVVKWAHLAAVESSASEAAGSTLEYGDAITLFRGLHKVANA